MMRIKSRKAWKPRATPAQIGILRRISISGKIKYSMLNRWDGRSALSCFVHGWINDDFHDTLTLSNAGALVLSAYLHAEAPLRKIGHRSDPLSPSLAKRIRKLRMVS